MGEQKGDDGEVVRRREERRDEKKEWSVPIADLAAARIGFFKFLSLFTASSTSSLLLGS